MLPRQLKDDSRATCSLSLLESLTVRAIRQRLNLVWLPRAHIWLTSGSHLALSCGLGLLWARDRALLQHGSRTRARGRHQREDGSGRLHPSDIQVGVPREGPVSIAMSRPFVHRQFKNLPPARPGASVPTQELFSLSSHPSFAESCLGFGFTVQ